MGLCFFSRLAICGCLVLLADEVSSWTNNAPNPVVTTRGADSIVFNKKKIQVDPPTALQKYLDRAGVFRLCDIGPTKYGRGLVARRDLQPGETVLRIPLSQTIVIETSQSSQEASSISDAWAGQLAQKLIKEQQNTKENVSNIIRTYSDVLPPPPPTPARGDWSLEVLQMLGHSDILRDIEIAQAWRNDQWEMFGESNGALGDQQRFFDALDLVSSRTIRCGSKFMLVPFLDMANYASRDQGGGYYSLVKGPRGDDEIELKIGDRGVKTGGEVFLDYGDRSNEEWLIYYGFLPDRNTAESIILPDSPYTITWDDVNGARDESLKEECKLVLYRSSTTLIDDMQTLNELEADENDNDITKVLALKYRIARKTLLSAVAGAKTSSAFTSAFL